MTRRGYWAVHATVTLGLALLVEKAGGLLADTVIDVVSDPLWTAGVALLAAVPVVAQRALAAESSRAWQDRLLGVALGLALGFSLVLGYAIWPSYLLSGIAFVTVVLGLLGILGLAALVATIVVAAQAVEIWIERPRARTAFVVGGLAALGLFVVRPVLIARSLRSAVHAADAPHRDRALSQLRRLGALSDVRSLIFGFPATGNRLVGDGGWGVAPIPFEPLEGSRVWTENGPRLYFLASGDATPQTRGRGFWDPRHGAQKVGETIDGLALTDSTQTVRYSPASQTAESLWTLVFDNQTGVAQEARASVALPEGCVISDAWLWIDGKPRPAAFTSKGKAIAAYQTIAVAERKDPLLVTSVDPRHAFVQCFPVPAGKTMQIRLQLTHAALGGQFVPATLLETNFALRPTQVRVNGTAFEGERLPSGTLTLPPGIVAGESPRIVPIALDVAIDPSAAVGRALDPDALIAELRKLPAGSTVRLTDTRRNASTDWTAANATPRAFLDGLTFVGGVDPVVALARLHEPTRLPHTIVWVHGALPEAATAADDLLIARRRQQPALVSVALEPGENALVEGLADPSVRCIDGGDWPRAVVQALGAVQRGYDPNRVPLGGQEPALGGLYVTPDARTDEPGDWPRLAAASRIFALWAHRANDTSLAKAAASRRLITPVSGAVVLETKAQYDRFGLDPKRKKAAEIPGSTPEPGEMAAFAVLVLGVAGLVVRKKLSHRA